MRKIFFICALALISAWSWAEINITVNPNMIDFGTVYLDGNGEAESDWEQAILTWSGLLEYGSVFVDTLEAPTIDEACEFYISSDDDSDYWYGGDTNNEPTSPNVWVAFYALEAGEFSVKYGFYSFKDEWWEIKSAYTELLVKVKVVDPNDQGSTTGMENVATKVESRKMLRNGRLIIERNGEAYTLTGAKL